MTIEVRRPNVLVSSSRIRLRALASAGAQRTLITVPGLVFFIWIGASHTSCAPAPNSRSIT
jgi:hypothetical protein